MGNLVKAKNQAFEQTFARRSTFVGTGPRIISRGSLFIALVAYGCC